MIRMYYISTAVEGLAAKDYDEILGKARKNNSKLGVTGLLVVKGGFFAQALEGEEQDVMELFEKIKLDKRHYRVVMISRKEVQERIFQDWEMGFKDINVSVDCADVDLNDPKYVEHPELLDRAFRHVIEVETSKHG
ncbi:MAG: BLUF domain-containing protein [Mariniblastus sp.]